MIKRYSQFINEDNNTYNLPDTKEVMDYVLPLLDESSEYHLTYMLIDIDRGSCIQYVSPTTYNHSYYINKTIYGYCFTIKFNMNIEIDSYINDILIDKVLPNIADENSCVLLYRIMKTGINTLINKAPNDSIIKSLDKPKITLFVIDPRIKDKLKVREDVIEYKRND